MSLRKSPQLTPDLLGAARQNAQHSDGPHSAAAKQNSKLNALKHGANVSLHSPQSEGTFEAAEGICASQSLLLVRMMTRRRSLSTATFPPMICRMEVIGDLKTNERCGNVTENKRPLWKTGAEAGMSQKTKVVTC